MSPRRRQHPLQTFRFWFFVVGAVAVTLVWRFDLLPFKLGRPETGKKREESFTEVQLSEPSDWAEPLRRPRRPSASTLPESPAAEASLGDDPFLATETVLAKETVDEPSTDWRTPDSENPFFEREVAYASAPPQSEDELFLSDMGGPLHEDHGGVVQTVSVSDPFAAEETPPAQISEPQAAAPGIDPGIDFAEIERLSQSNAVGDHIEAHRELSRLYWQQPESRGQLRTRIDALAQRIYFSPQPHYMEAHELQPGDRLQSIAKQYNVPWQYLAKLNRVDAQRVRAGQRIKVIKGPFSAIIDLSDYEITLHAHGYFVTRYPVGIGKDGSTPLGSFTVEEKLVDPTYYGPDRVIDHDDPSNPLGERWIDLGNSYGIHGTIDPGSIGRSESRGCIRMHNDDVAAVYDLLSIGSEVTIRE